VSAESQKEDEGTVTDPENISVEVDSNSECVVIADLDNEKSSRPSSSALKAKPHVKFAEVCKPCSSELKVVCYIN